MSRKRKMIAVVTERTTEGAEDMSMSEQKLQEYRAAITQTKDLVTELIQSQPETLKDPVIRYQLWRLRKELAGIDLDWSEKKKL